MSNFTILDKERLNIMLLIDNNYVYYSLPFIYSIIKNNFNWASIYFYVVSDNLNPYYKDYIINFTKSYEAEIEICYVDSSLFNGLKSSQRYPALLYYKLVPHLVLPRNIDKTIFFDIDMICNGSLQELYNIVIDKYYFAMCYGLNSFKRQSLNLRDGVDSNYHNSGMMLINLKKLRNDNITINTYLEYSRKNNQGNLLEEFFLNNMYYGKILSLMPYDYNFNPGGRFMYSEYCNQMNITPKKVIIHYMPFGNDSPIVKPWDAYEYFYGNKTNNIYPQDL